MSDNYSKDSLYSNASGCATVITLILTSVIAIVADDIFIGLLWGVGIYIFVFFIALLTSNENGDRLSDDEIDLIRRRATYQYEAEREAKLKQQKEQKRKYQKDFEPHIKKLSKEIVKFYTEEISSGTFFNSQLAIRYGVYPKEEAEQKKLLTIGNFEIDHLPKAEKFDLVMAIAKKYNARIEEIQPLISELNELIAQADKIYPQGKIKNKIKIPHISLIQLPDRDETNYEGKKTFSNDRTYNKALESAVNQIIRDHQFLKTSYRVTLPFPSRERHMYILGSSGSGKSELLKRLFHEDIQADYSLVALDPHGDLVEQCSEFSIFNDKKYSNKLVYISAQKANEGIMPRFNVLEHSYHLLPEFERRNAISLRVAELVNAFEVIFEKDFTPNMSLLLTNSLRLLMEQKNSCLTDLIDMLHPDTTDQYIELAQSHYDERIRKYFANLFPQDRLNPTKAAVITRFENSLSNQSLSMLLTARKSSFDIEKLLDTGSIILINVSQADFGEVGTKIFGSFLVAMITSYALARAKVPAHKRKPVFCYIDECQNFLSPRIDKVLSEARKYGLHLILANQYLTQFSGEGIGKLKSSVMSNTEIKFVGKSSSQDQTQMSREMKIDIKDVADLKAGRFVCKIGSYKALVIQTDGFLVINKNQKNAYYMNRTDHDKLMNEQYKKYYRSEVASRSTKPKKDDGFDPEIDSLLS